MFSGFSIGGIDWLWPDHAHVPGREAKANRIATMGFEDARLTHSMGGNILRIFVNFGHILAPLSATPLDLAGLGVSYDRPWYLQTQDQKIAICDAIIDFLGLALR